MVTALYSIYLSKTGALKSNHVKKDANGIFLSTCLIFLASILYISFVPTQSDFALIILPYSLAFGCYLYFSFGVNGTRLKHLIALGVMIRFLMVFTFPNLSDDIYRFIWDGRLLHQGINPYAVLPSDIVDQFPGIDQRLYDRLNSPDYYTIYPPLSQLFNYLATFFNSENYIIESIIFKGMLFCCDLLLIPVVIRLLKTINLPPATFLLYYMNPLIIVETIGNCHFEGVMILFFASGLLYLVQDQQYKSSVSYAVSIAAKMLTLMLSPAIFNYIQRPKDKIKYTISTAISALILFAPVIYFMSQHGSNIVSSFDLYLKKFEFNGGIYYALRYIGYKIYGFNMIHVLGPLLSSMTLVSILYLSFKNRIKTFKELAIVMLFAYVIFILLSRTVHPWYLSLALFLSIFTRYRFTVLWTYLIAWTYINYSYPTYSENLLVVTIEYALVLLFMINELRSPNKPEIGHL